ncbi:hypothetical protein V8E53_000502 [Lactarius tabidus]
MEQVRSKYQNEILVAKSNAYKQAIKDAELAGCAQAEEATKAYTANLMNTAKEQARLKADSEFSCLLADEHNSLSLEAEKEFVLAAATRLGLNLEDMSQPAKKVKLVHRQAQPAPTTPRGRSLSVSSSTSQTSHSRKRAYSPSEIEVKNPIPAREALTTPKPVTTVTFALKQESPAPNFTTPPTPSVIREAVDIADAPSITPGLRGLSSSIHNETNQMVLDPESIDYRTIFPPGIPAPPSTQSLPPRMSRTPAFGDEQALNDGVNTSITPSVPPQGNTAFSLEALSRVIGEKIQPLWDSIRKLEAKVDGRLPRAPIRAGPGYRAEFIHHSPAPQVSAAPVTMHVRIQAADPLPSANPLPHEDVAAATPTPLASAVCEPPSLDDEEFPALEQGMAPSTSCKKRARGVASVAQQQQVKRSVDQARAVQGRRPAGNQGPRPSLQDANLTEVTVIRFGGLEDKEEERKFRARNPIQIVQSVQHDLARRSKNPPAVLSGRWSQSDTLKSSPPKVGRGFNYVKYLRRMKTTVYGVQTIFWEHLGRTHASKTPSFVFNHIGKATPLLATRLSQWSWWPSLTTTTRRAKLHSLMGFACSEPKSSSYDVETTPRYNNAEDATNLATTQTRLAANCLKEPSSVTGAAVITTAGITIMNAMHAHIR